MKRYKMKRIALLAAVCLACCALFSVTSAVFADEEATEYYVCFSNENYRIRNANKMTEEAGEYYLFDVSLSSVIDFYVTDLYGTHYYAKDGKEFSVSETGYYRYVVKFSPTDVYDEEKDGFEKTNCHITYKFYAPADIRVRINDKDTPMTYNNYRTDYDVYYLSCVYLTKDTTVSFDEESHTIGADGWYRILYTPGSVREGNEYLFDENGNFGSGDDYAYHIYVEDAARFFVTFVNEEITEKTADKVINGEKAYLLERYENNVTAPEYRGARFFAPEPEYTLKYRVYEETPDGGFRLIDDDNDEDTSFSQRQMNDVGWQDVCFSDIPTGYVTTFSEKTYDFEGWYLIGNFNGWGFTARGETDVDDNWKMAKLEETDEDYDKDYDQYRLTVTVTERQLKEDDFEFYISDGKTKYKNLTEYIAIDKAGRYEITFSDEHVYGRGRNYYYTLLDEKADKREILIGTTAEFAAFAQKCNASADFSATAEAYLTADLDFSGAEFVPVNVFDGVFHGGYHVLKNITVGSDGEVNSVFGAVTTDGVIERLRVENLRIDNKDGDYVGFVGKNYGTISGVTVTGTLLGSQFVGGVAAYNGRTAETTGSTLEVYVNGKVKNCLSDVAVRGFVNVGGICGYSDGEVENCKNSGAVSGVSYRVNTTPVNLGGVVGYSSGKISQCENTGRLSSENSSMYVGGIAGLCTGDVYFCFNRADVAATKYVGGVVGYYGTISRNDSDLQNYFGGVSFENFVDYFTEDEGDFEQVDGRTHVIVYAVNNGKVRAKSYVGGIVGYTEVAFEVRCCVSDGEEEGTAGNYVGGIVGYGNNVIAVSCLSAGTVSAKGTGAGNYVGGILGYGNSVRYSFSGATVSGSDYVGGIAGGCTGILRGNWTNVLLSSAKDAENVGDVAGNAESYNEALGDFNGLVSYNYYVGTVGGIAKREYGMNTDYAAAKLATEKLASVGVLSPYLADEFSVEYWLGGKDEATFPVSNYLENVMETSEYGDDKEFEEIFAVYDEFSGYAEKYARITYLVGFFEWNKDNGDLLDDDGMVQTDNFELIATYRLYSGEALENAPAFRFAETKNGVTMYEGNKARYFVSFVLPAAADRNCNVYAVYREISTTLTDVSGKVLVEGLFDAATEVQLTQTTEGYGLRFFLNGEEQAEEACFVKFLVGDGAENYVVTLYPSGAEAASTVSGKYVGFTLKNGETFTVREKEKTALPLWAYILLSVCGGAAVTAAVFGIVRGVRRKRK